MSKPPDYSNCPKCNQPARCRIIRERRPKDISLDGPAQQVLLVGVYRCKHCQKYFTVQPQVVSPRKRYTDRARGKVYDGIVQDKLTFLASPRRASPKTQDPGTPAHDLQGSFSVLRSSSTRRFRGSEDHVCRKISPSFFLLF